MHHLKRRRLRIQRTMLLVLRAASDRWRCGTSVATRNSGTEARAGKWSAIRGSNAETKVHVHLKKKKEETVKRKKRRVCAAEMLDYVTEASLLPASLMLHCKGVYACARARARRTTGRGGT